MPPSPSGEETWELEGRREELLLAPSQPGRTKVEATSSESFLLHPDGELEKDTATAPREGV